MRVKDVPEKLYIRGQRWLVLWRDHEDPDWRAQRAWGVTYHAAREIHLDDAMRHLPEQLAATWLHELMHACLPDRGRKRPKNISDKIEETFISAVSPWLAKCLHQTGWKRP